MNTMHTKSLDNTQLKQLRSLAHSLKPVVRVGQHGITDGVRRELESALAHHELVKIKLGAANRDARDKMLASLCEFAAAVIVQRIGNTGVLFRRNRQAPVIKFGADNK